MTSFKIKYEDLLKNVTKFNKGKENLNMLLSSQKMSNNHFGLGFSKDNMYKPTHVGIGFSKTNFVKSTHLHNPYNSFVKRNDISKRIRCKYIWVPKNLNNVDKNVYIASYIHDVCNSKNYVYTNKWKPNSNWIWVPKG